MKLNNIPLELDNRIFDIADIKTVITADENDVGKMGYFANSIHLFKNLEGLDGIKYGKLIYLSDLDYGGDKSDKCFVCSNQWAYRYFIPEDALKPEEPKEPEEIYRAFSLNEFSELYAIGDVVTYRLKDCEVIEQSMLIGFQSSDDEDIPGNGYVLIGNCRYGFMELFNNYELKHLDHWQPFGIEVEE